MTSYRGELSNILICKEMKKKEAAMENVLKLVTCVAMVSQLMLTSVAVPLKRVLQDNYGVRNFGRTPMVTSEQESESTSQQKVRVLIIPSITRRVRLFNKNGYFLQICPRRKLRGTSNATNPYTIIEMESVGSSIVRLKGVMARVYFCMNDKGIVYVMAQATDECVFKERLGENYFHTYASYKYHGLNPGNYTNNFYIAIKRNGKFKHATNTSLQQKSVDFLVIPLNE